MSHANVIEARFFRENQLGFFCPDIKKVNSERSMDLTGWQQVMIMMIQKTSVLSSIKCHNSINTITIDLPSAWGYPLLQTEFCSWRSTGNERGYKDMIKHWLFISDHLRNCMINNIAYHCITVPGQISSCTSRLSSAIRWRLKPPHIPPWNFHSFFFIILLTVMWKVR